MFDINVFISKFHYIFKDNVNMLNRNQKICIACSGDTKSLGLLYMIYNYACWYNEYDLDKLHCSSVIFTNEENYKQKDEFMKNTCKSLGIQYLPIYIDNYINKAHKKYILYRSIVNKCKEIDVRYIILGNVMDDRIDYFYNNLHNLKKNLNNIIKNYKATRSANLTMIRPLMENITKKEISQYLSNLGITPIDSSDNDKDLNLNNITDERDKSEKDKSVSELLSIIDEFDNYDVFINKTSLSELLTTIEEYNVFINKTAKDYIYRFMKKETMETHSKITLELKGYILNYNYRILLKFLIFKILSYKVDYKKSDIEKIDIKDLEHISNHVSKCPNENRNFNVRGIKIEYIKFDKREGKGAKLIFYKPNEENS